MISVVTTSHRLPKVYQKTFLQVCRIPLWTLSCLFTCSLCHLCHFDFCYGSFVIIYLF